MEAKDETTLMGCAPVFPSADVGRDVEWYKQRLDMTVLFADDKYAVLNRDQFFLHLQWHAGTDEDPLTGGSVVRIFAENIVPIFQELLAKKLVEPSALLEDTAWGTTEFGLYDENKNAIILVESKLHQ